MNAPHAEAMGVLIQADLDGELDAVQAADLALHVAACDECQALAAELRTLKAALQSELPRYRAPPALKEALQRSLATRQAAAPPVRRFRWRPFFPAFGGFVAGAAIAALLAVAVLPRAVPEDRRVADAVATATLRSLQPGHLLDVQGSAPAPLAAWLASAAGFAPPVRTPAGFTLAGGRLDYLHHRPVAVLAYQRHGQTIELYLWPEQHRPTPPVSIATAGIALTYWREGGVEFWAAGQSPEDVDLFVRAWRGTA